MSPEIQRARTSKGWATHERRRKAFERSQASLSSSIVQPPEDPTQQHWDLIEGTVNRTFTDDMYLLEFFRKHKRFFRRFTDGRRDIALGIGSERFDELIRGFENPDSPTFNPGFLDEAAPISRLITAETAKLSKRR